MDQLKVRVKSIEYLAQDILAYEFEGLESSLPNFTSGSHIDLIVENIPVRSYSLYNNFDHSQSYKIAIQKTQDSRGGSIGYQTHLHAGQIVHISVPRNSFTFRGIQPNVVFLAGGIGITPILSMIENMPHPHWKLYYFARSEEKCAFAKQLRDRFPENIEILFSSTGINKRIEDIVQDFEAQTTEFYCCGPKNMIEAFKSFESEYPHCYYESFVAEHEISTENCYTVELHKSAKSIQVLQGETLLEALLRHNCDVMHSCKEGICGACEIAIIAGEADHRDSILTDQEKQQNKTIFPCCSSAKGSLLILDL